MAVDMYGARAIVATFPAERIEVLRVGPGLRERRPRVSVPWNWSNEKERFEDEAIWQNTTVITKMGPARIDALDYRWPEESSKWIYSKTQAQSLAQKVGMALGAGLILWQWRSLDAEFGLEVGDAVAVETTQFLAKDPNAARALRGKLWAIATLTDVTFENGFWTFTGWVQGYQDIFAAPGDSTLQPKPSLRDAQLAWRGFTLYPQWTGDSKTQSVRVATSTSVQPPAGQGFVADGQTGEYNSGAFTWAQVVYATITPYTGLGATGVQGEAKFLKWRSSYDGGSLLPTPVSGTPFSYQQFAGVNFASVSWSWTAQTIYLPDGTTIAIPASSSLSVPAAPTLGQVAGGALGARTRYVRIGYVKISGGARRIYSVSAESNFAISANNLLTVTAPTNPGGYDGWCVLVGTASNTEFTQGAGNLTVLTFGVNWTEPAGGATTSGTTAFQTNWVNAVTEGYLGFSTTYHYYPYWDTDFAALQPNAIGVIVDGQAPTGGASATSAQLQVQSGHIGLILRASAATGPVVGSMLAITLAASGGGSSGSGGGKF